MRRRRPRTATPPVRRRRPRALVPAGRWTGRPRLGAAAIAAVGALVVAGCGGSGRSGLTPVEQNQLLGLIAQARAAAVAGDAAGAETALGKLRTTVSGLRAAGALDPGRAARMQSVAAQALSDARAGTRPAAPTAPTVAAPTRPVTTTPAAAAPVPSPAPTVVDRTPPGRDRVGTAKQLDQLKKQVKEQTKARAGHGPGKGD